MPRIVLAALIVFLTPCALAKSPEHAAVAHAAKACTKDGAFGRSFGDAGYGHVDSVADDAWAPFRHLTISATQGGGTVISAEASFHDAGNSRAEDIALAQHFLKALDKAVAAKHRFPHRDTSGNGVTFHTSNQPDAGLIFDIHQEGDRVIAECVDLGN